MKVSLPHNFAPRWYQARSQAYFDDGGKRAMEVLHRRAGKDLNALHEECKLAHQRVGVYWHCLPTYKQAKKALWDGFTRDGKRIMEEVFPASIVRRKNETEMLVELKCGSLVQLVGSDTMNNLVGAGPVHVTFSEFALCKPSTWDLVRPMLRENGGSAWFITTPRGKNHAWKLAQVAKQEAGWFYQHLNVHETGAFPNPELLLQEERREGMPEALVRQEYLCDWTAALVGSVWGDLLEQLEKAGGMEAFTHEKDGLFTSWDLGFTDSTALWVWRLNGEGGVDFVDWYEAHGKPLSHYFDVIEGWEKKGYRFVKHWLPHDAAAHTLATGVSILDQALKRFDGAEGRAGVAIGPALSLMDGVQAARWLLQQGVRFHPRCGEGVEALRQYAYAYDEDKKVFTSKPEHSWASHTADAFRYAACVARATELLTRKPKPAPPPQVKSTKDFTMDEAWALHKPRGSGRI